MRSTHFQPIKLVPYEAWLTSLQTWVITNQKGAISGALVPSPRTTWAHLISIIQKIRIYLKQLCWPLPVTYERVRGSSLTRVGWQGQPQRAPMEVEGLKNDYLCCSYLIVITGAAANRAQHCLHVWQLPQGSLTHYYAASERALSQGHLGPCGL